MAKETLFQNYLTTASDIILEYRGDVPLKSYLKQFFAQHKKYGSRDRKYIVHLCYCFYRLGHVGHHYSGSIKEKILMGLWLGSYMSNELLAHLEPGLNENVALATEEKLSFVQNPFVIADIFPWQHELSETIAAAAFAKSHLIQPDLFARIRPGLKQQVIRKLTEKNIQYTEINNECLAFTNNTKVDNVLAINKEVVIQDYSSQRISEFLQIIQSQIKKIKSKISAWDCCAASGGKSILAMDVLGNIKLTVSDIRSSIIHNLKQRFAEAGIKKYNSAVVDLTNSKSQIPNSPFDIIIADVPCSGSGTWSRTPEQLYFFTKDKIDDYASLQKRIIRHVIPQLNPGGYFLYITCSVFKKENEDAVDFIKTKFPLQLIKQEVLNGYDKKADTMFAALFATTLKEE